MIGDIKKENFKDIPIEVIPKDNYLDIAETIIKVPYGIHPVSRESSYFVERDFEDNIHRRLILLYVIKFLDNGEEILHYIFENMNNYSFNITEKNISKSFSNPISCEKIRNYLRDGSSTIKCLCNGSVSCPLIKVDAKKYSGMLYKDEMKNIIEKIIKLKNEKKSIERNITILENKLEKIFKLNDYDEVNVELGKLKKKDDKWIIEMEI